MPILRKYSPDYERVIKTHLKRLISQRSLIALAAFCKEIRTLREENDCPACVIRSNNRALPIAGCTVMLFPSSSYYWSKQGEDPNAPHALCEACAREEEQYWDDAWAEYQSSCM